MKTINALLILTLSFLILSPLKGSNKGEIKIQFETNKFYSHYLFSQALANAMGTSPTMKVIFDESDFAKEETIQKAITKIQQINTFYEYKFEGYPKHRYNGIQLWQLLKIAASTSTNLDDFSSRIIGMLPANDLSDLIESVKVLEPVHEQLVWEPNKEPLDNYLKQLRKEALKGNFQRNFKKAANFYRSTWNHSIPFKVFILPIPDHNGAIYEIATPEGNTLTYSIKIKKNPNLAKDLGVIFHELCHILYKNQTKDIQHEQEKIFLNHSSKFKIIGYQVLDEAVATAIGQGWYYKELIGKLDPDMWYAVEQVNNVGKAIFDLVEEYMDSDKTLDTDFVNRYLQLYEHKFADDLTSIKLNMSNVNLLMSESMSNPNLVFPYFFEYFDMRSIQDITPLNEQNLLDWQHTLGTKMIILDSKSKRYDFLSKRIDWLPKMENPENILITNIVNGEQYYILIISAFEDIKKAFKLLIKKENLNNRLEKTSID